MCCRNAYLSQALNLYPLSLRSGNLRYSWTTTQGTNLNHTIYIVGSGYIANAFKGAFKNHIHKTAFITDRKVEVKSEETTYTIRQFSQFAKTGALDGALILVATGPGTPNTSQEETRIWLEKQKNLIDSAIRQAQGIHIVLVSSGGAIYGDHGDAVLDESATTKGVTPYAIYQIAVEELYKDALNENLTILRFTNPYGILQFSKSNQGLIQTLIKNLYDNQFTIVYGNGLIVRDYFYEDDLSSLVNALVIDRVNGTYNISSGLGRSQIEIIHAIESVFGGKLKISYREAENVHIKTNVLSPIRAQKDLGWTPTSNLLIGLEKIRSTICSGRHSQVRQFEGQVIDLYGVR